MNRRMFLGGAAALPAFGSWALAGASPPAPGASQVLDIMALEPLARAALPPAHFGYIATGVDDDLTVVRNHEAFGHYGIRAHRFTDLRHLDTSRTLFGERWPSPLYLSAVSAMRAFHPQGELAVARAAKTRGAPLMLSSGTSTPLDAVSSALGQAPWQQLYPTDDWQVTLGIVRRAQAAGCPVIVLTVDSAVDPRNNETLKRAMRADQRDCLACHRNNSHDMWRRGPMFSGLDVSHVTQLQPPDLTPGWLDRLRREVKVRLYVKGIVTAEDARLAIEHGADAVIVSNHGGRNEETLRATIDCLPEIVAAARGRIPVLIDGGIRRGTDIFKALALGATAVGIGRPQAWGLAAFGQSGVEAALDILNRELAAIMRQAGTPNLAAITGACVLRDPST
jgi:4-hydroxymandelate oxidase